MANKYGFSSVNRQVNFQDSKGSQVSSQIEEINQKFIYARVVDIILNETNNSIDGIIQIDVDFSVLQKRIEGRAKDDNNEIREDDNLQVMKKRLQVYIDQTEPLISYYSNHINFIVINGMNDISKVSEDIKNNLIKLK